MNARTHKPITREHLESRLQGLTKSVLACFDQGMVDIDIELHPSTVEVTRPTDPHQMHESAGHSG